MPPWIHDLILALLGSSPFMAGIGWWFKTRHDDRLAREQAYVNEIKELQEEIKKLYQDRIQYEMVRRESSDKTMNVLSEMMNVLKSIAEKRSS